MAEAEKDDWLDDFDSLDDKGSELDQSDFDALLSGASGPGTAAGAPPPGKEEGAELDQSAIDTLMSGAGAPPPAGESSELDQSDIDSLLASPNAPVTDQGAIDPDQEEIDKLFSDVESGGSEEENTFPAEEIDFKDVFDSTDPAPQGTNLGFDAEEFKLDVDIPEIPANPPTPDFVAPPVQAEAAAVSAPAAAVDPTMKITPETGSVESTPESGGPDVAAQGLGLLHNRALRMGLGVGLAVLLGVVGFFFMKDRAKTPPAHQQAAEVAVHPTPAVTPQEPAIPPPEPPPAAEPPKPEPEPAKPHNAAPTVADLDLTVPPESSQLTITLNGTDPENDPLQYVMSMPEHGLLSGHPPNLVYTPNQDFNGQDGFIVRATDGKNISAPATIRISGKFTASAKGAPPGGTEGKPDGSGPLEAAKTEKAGACPATDGEKGQGLLAKNKSYTLSGSKGLVINWQKIWCDANATPYKPDVEIDILAAPKHGALSKINDHQSLYRPGKAFRGKDSITYRFKQGTLTSESKTILVSVARKKSPPVIRLQPIAASYMTGDTVILNASQTSVGRHEPLTFHWTQLAGVPVRIKPLNSEGSQISFVVPSSYSAVSHPTLLFQVTATDQEGLQGSRDIKISAQSRRQSALWDARN